MKVFLHGDTVDVRVLEVVEGQTVAEIIELAGDGTEVVAWIEEATDPLDPRQRIIDAGVGEYTHLHVGPRRDVEVTVRFGGEAKKKQCAPSQTVETVFRWAVGGRGFDLPGSQRPKHTLGLCGSQDEADRRQHLGSLSVDGTVCFDLAPKTRYQG